MIKIRLTSFLKHPCTLSFSCGSLVLKSDKGKFMSVRVSDIKFSTCMHRLYTRLRSHTNLVLDLSANLLQRFLLGLGQRQLGGHRVSFSNERAFLLLSEQERTWALQFLSEEARGGRLIIFFNKIQQLTRFGGTHMGCRQQRRVGEGRRGSWRHLEDSGGLCGAGGGTGVYRALTSLRVTAVRAGRSGRHVQRLQAWRKALQIDSDWSIIAFCGQIFVIYEFSA